MPADPADIAIRPFDVEDWPRVVAIYAAGIATGHATFETEPPSWETWNGSRLERHRFVAIIDGAVVGWVAASAVSDRCVYGGVIEHSVYVDPDVAGRGVGSALLRVLIDDAETCGVWTIQSGIFPENTASLAVHAKAGFRIVGRRERIGQLHGVWRDTLLVERRSTTIN